MVPPPPFNAGRRLGGASAPLACQPRVLLGDPGEASSVDSSSSFVEAAAGASSDSLGSSCSLSSSCHVMFAHFILNHGEP